MVKIKFSRKSGRDLNEIKEFISADNQERSDSFTDELIGRFISTVSQFPLSSPQYGFKNARKYTYKDYNIYYSYNKNKNIVNVLHIIHGSQILNQLLQK